MTVFIRPQAAAEIELAVAWYEKQRLGLGEELLTGLMTTLASIEANPRRYRVIHRDSRSALLDRFPYLVVYRILEDHLVVLSFFHANRDPSTLPDEH